MKEASDMNNTNATSQATQTVTQTQPNHPDCETCNPKNKPYVLVACKKYAQRTVRVVMQGSGKNGEKTAMELLESYQAMECPLCGPCSHVEISWRNQFAFHGEYDTEEQALAARRSLVKQDGYSETY